MFWLLKRLALVYRSKTSMSIISFILGYLFNQMISTNVLKNEEIAIKEYSSHLVNNGRDVFLVVLILSSVNNFSRRQTLRETWLSSFPNNNEVRYYFIISTGNAGEDQKTLISIEQEKHNDLLIFPNLEDSFYTLTLKITVAFGWLTDIPVLDNLGKSDTPKPFGGFKYVLKCDDDSFVRLTEILNELKTVFSGSKGENLYWGFFDGQARVKKSGKYKEDQWNICDYYIPYALGGGYVLARPLVEFISKNGNHLKKYKSEDTSVGAWLSSYVDVNRVHDPRFDTEYISRGCHQTYLITHKHSEMAMRNYHNNLKNFGHLCQKEYRTRMSYNYNWQLVPSKCCARVNPNIP